MFNCCRLWRTKQNCEEPLLSQWLLVSQQWNFIYLHSIVQIPEVHSDLQLINLHSIIYLSAIISLHISCFIPMSKPRNVTQSRSRMTDNLMYNYFMLIISSNHLFQHSPNWAATQETHFLYLLMNSHHWELNTNHLYISLNQYTIFFILPEELLRIGS